jgi:ATP-dependent DNA helicase DinG
VAESFQSRLPATPAAWIYTSATLAVGGGFGHYTRLLGLGDPRTRLLDSPFDYRRNALLYVPEAMPDPNAPDYGRAVVEAARAVFAASGGRAFFLFTSHRALRLAANQLEGRIEHPLLVQGTAPKAQLLEQFRRLGNAVLLGTTSFWEGVDVRGDALSCVVIDRLPFAAPGDPVLAARIAALRARGQDPFVHVQLPWAVIMLKQGVGRLIRDVNDRGVLVICDPRLLTRSYGKVFRDSLPPLVLTRSIEDVAAFFQAGAQRSATAPVPEGYAEVSGISYEGTGDPQVAQGLGAKDHTPRR